MFLSHCNRIEEPGHTLPRQLSCLLLYLASRTSPKQHARPLRRSSPEGRQL